MSDEIYDINKVIDIIFSNENLNNEENLKYFEDISNLSNKLKLKPTEENLDILFNALLNSKKFPLVIRLLIERVNMLKRLNKN
jgi:hypothetical protein